MVAAPPTYGEAFLEWLREHAGLKWQCDLSDDDIDGLEAKWGVLFPPDYRLLLRKLHAPADPPAGARFYDWRDDEALRRAFDWPVQGLAFDVEHNELWLEGWGSRPADPDARRIRLKQVVNAEAAPLIPVLGHRYLVGLPLEAGNPVLSIHQADIIVYGDDLRGYLLHELFGTGGRCAAGEPILERWCRIPFWGSFVS